MTQGQRQGIAAWPQMLRWLNATSAAWASRLKSVGLQGFSDIQALVMPYVCAKGKQVRHTRRARICQTLRPASVPARRS